MNRPVRLHLEDRLHLDPDWVIVGVAYPDANDSRVLLIASRSLDRVTLTHRAETMLEDFPEMMLSDNYQGYTLTAELSNAVLATGENYADAFTNLLKHWDPDRPDDRMFDAIEGAVEDK